MENISIFKNLVEHQEDKSFAQIFNLIQTGTYKKQVEKIRQKIADGQNAEVDKLKKSLPAFTASGSFLNGRKANLITTYSQYIILDIDKLSPAVVQLTKDKSAIAPYTFGAFISPSGTGIKIIVKTNASLQQHKEVFAQVSAYYEKALEITIDQSGKDVSRLCFFSYDHDIFINTQALPYEIETPKAEEIPLAIKKEPAQTDWSKKFNEAIVFTEKIQTYQEGNRNNFIHLLTCNCNRKGIPENDTLEFIKSKYDLPISEIETSVKNVYQNNNHEFAKSAKSANIANLQSEDDDTPTIDFLKETPIIPDGVYRTLPNVLSDALQAFDKPRKKDVFLTSAIVVLSGCMPEVTGIYHQERVYTHLFSFVIAPAASGKGVLKNAKRLGDKIHQGLLEASKTAKKEYDEKLFEYNQIKKTAKKAENVPPKPEEPSYKLLFIPADCSQSRMVQLLNNNDGQGIICETEADSMSGANKQDWGNYSHLLRAAFHHEKISLSRKTDNELIEIQEPRIAVALSGTPSQVPKLIASAEDGLFSRFLFYAFKSEIEWLDPSPKEGAIIHNDHFERLSIKIFELNNFLSGSPTDVLLTPTQWSKLNRAFEKYLNEVAIFTGDDAISIVFRLGLIAFRICMIFSALRKLEDGTLDTSVYCLDQDFENAISLSEIYLKHSLLIYNNLSDKQKKDDYELPNNKQKFFEALPNAIFKRKEAVALGETFNLSPRTVDGFLRASVPSILTLVKTGYYQKKSSS